MTRNFSLEQIPVYVRAGEILPMMPKMEYTGQKPVDPLIVNVFPLADKQHSSYTVYEDSGEGEQYQKGVCAWTEVDVSRNGNQVGVVMQPVKGSYPGMLKSRGFEVRLPGDWPPSLVTVNGVPVAFEKTAGKPGWKYEGNTLSTIVTVGPHPVSELVTV